MGYTINIDTDATPHDTKSREYFNNRVEYEDMPETKRVESVHCSCGMEIVNAEAYEDMGSWWVTCPECLETIEIY